MKMNAYSSFIFFLVLGWIQAEIGTRSRSRMVEQNAGHDLPFAGPSQARDSSEVVKQSIENKGSLTGSARSSIFGELSVEGSPGNPGCICTNVLPEGGTKTTNKEILEISVCCLDTLRHLYKLLQGRVQTAAHKHTKVAVSPVYVPDQVGKVSTEGKAEKSGDSKTRSNPSQDSSSDSFEDLVRQLDQEIINSHKKHGLAGPHSFTSDKETLAPSGVLNLAPSVSGSPSDGIPDKISAGHNEELSATTPRLEEMSKAGKIWGFVVKVQDPVKGAPSFQLVTSKGKRTFNLKENMVNSRTSSSTDGLSNIRESVAISARQDAPIGRDGPDLHFPQEWNRLPGEHKLNYMGPSSLSTSPVQSADMGTVAIQVDRPAIQGGMVEDVKSARDASVSSKRSLLPGFLKKQRSARRASSPKTGLLKKIGSNRSSQVHHGVSEPFGVASPHPYASLVEGLGLNSASPVEIEQGTQYLAHYAR